jgi:hypothetical protein
MAKIYSTHGHIIVYLNLGFFCLTTGLAAAAKLSAFARRNSFVGSRGRGPGDEEGRGSCKCVGCACVSIDKEEGD